MTVNELITALQLLKPSLRDKPVFIVAPNGLKFEPKPKCLLGKGKNYWDEDAVESVLLTYE